MIRYRILPYRQGSKSAKALAEALGGKVLKLEGSKYKAKYLDIVINWGYTGDIPSTLSGYAEPMLNGPGRIRPASNKLRFFELLKDKDVTPQYWTTQDAIPDEAFPIVCRTILAGHSGAGIVIAATRSGLVSAPLYVKYEKKKDEYRVHTGRTPTGETAIISVQRKARRTGLEDSAVNYQVRNLVNGFLYVRQGITPPSCVLELAKQAFEATGLDFGAVDVIYNENKGKAYVLEINTAPGLEGQTVTDYANFFNGLQPA